MICNAIMQSPAINRLKLAKGIANDIRARVTTFDFNIIEKVHSRRPGRFAVPRSGCSLQYPVLRRLLQRLAGMLGHGNRHRRLQSGALRSGAAHPPLNG